MSLKFSKEEQYAVRALVDLSNLDGYGRVKDLANRQNIPQRFLEQIFSKLKTSEVITGRRGPSGGYKLARPANLISLSDVFSALNPTLKSFGDNDTSDAISTKVFEVLTHVETEHGKVLKDISLSDVRNTTPVETKDNQEGEYTTAPAAVVV